MKNKNVFALVIAAAFLGCTDQKIQGTNGSSAAQNMEDFSSKGYKKGTVMYSPEAKPECQYMIILDDQSLLEPMRLSSDFQSADAKVWIKYQMQRRPNRCGAAQPIGIDDIKKREE